MSVSESARAPRLLRYPRRLKLVAIITVLLFAAALVVAGLSAWRQDNLTQSLREDTAWVVYKLDRDAVQLLNHLLADTRGRLSPAAQDALNLRFELLYSRITLLREGEISSLLQSISAASELLDQIQQQLDALDRGRWVDPQAGKVSFLRYFESWERDQVWTDGTRKAMSLAARSAARSTACAFRRASASTAAWRNGS